MRSDPVCKADVDEKTATNKAFYRGKDYYFCSTACRTQFQMNPESFGVGDGPESEEKARSRVRDMKEKVKERSTSFVERGKGLAAERLEGTAKTFREIAEDFRGETPVLSRYVDQIAEKIEGASQYLREKDLKEIINDTEHFIRSQPALIIGAAFAMGVITARFLKSSRKAQEM